MIEVIAPMPMRPHLYKYVCGIENLEFEQPLDISGLSLVPYMLQLIVERKPEWLLRAEQEHPENYSYGCCARSRSTRKTTLRSCRCA